MSAVRASGLKRIFLFLLLLLFTLGLLEGALRLTGIFSVYTETIGMGYTSAYENPLPTWYPSRPPNDSIFEDRKDFKYASITNSFGIRDKEWREEKDSAYRIIALGDSFAEGVGAPADSSWVRLLENLLQQRGARCEVFNAGISGSDPFFEYVLFRDKLARFRPDCVLVSINSSDIHDFILKGGMERFHADGTSHFRNAPEYEMLYEKSHIVRAFCDLALRQPLTGVFLNEDELAQEMNNSVRKICGVIDSFRHLLTRGQCH